LQQCQFQEYTHILAAAKLTTYQPPVAELIKAIVFYLISIGFLSRGDVFIFDNCTIHIHFKGENEWLQDVIWCEHGIMMAPLPAYAPELNPTELVFQTIVQRLRFILVGAFFLAMRHSLEQFTWFHRVSQLQIQ